MSTWFETSPSGLELIKRFEGCAKRRPDGLIEAYKVGDDLPTIGWGLTGAMPDGRPVQLGLTITQREADDALEWFVKNVSDPLTRKHFNAQSQHEFDALSSWTYNISHSKLERGEYSLPDLVNLKARDIDAVIAKWVQYKNPGTIFEQGLYRRRLAEVCMFLGLPWHFALNAVLKRAGGVIVDITLPDYVISQAERLAEMQAKERASREAPMTTEELNAAQLAKLRGEAPPARAPAPPAPKPKPAPAPKPAPKIEAPNVDLTAPPKPMEQSTTAKGMSNKDSGKETAAIGAVTTTGVFAMLPYAEKIAAFAERTNPQVIMVSIGVVAAVVLAVGVIRWWVGKMQMYDGRLNAKEPKI